MISLPFENPVIQAAWSSLPSHLEGKDQTVLASFQQKHPWGMDAAIDLQGCNYAAIRDATTIHRFSIELCHFIEMRQYGDPQIVRFGEDPRVSGITLVQLIETSNIVAHFIERDNAACLNIFSCSAYPPYQAAAFCQRWFQAQNVHLSVIFRGPPQFSEGEQ